MTKATVNAIATIWNGGTPPDQAVSTASEAHIRIATPPIRVPRAVGSAFRSGMLGLGLRGSYSNVDFSDVGGSTELKGIYGFVTYTAGF